LAPANETVCRLQASEDEVDRFERRKGHLVRAGDGDVGLNHPHCGDLHRTSSRIALLVATVWPRSEASDDASLSFLLPRAVKHDLGHQEGGSGRRPRYMLADAYARPR